MAGFTTFGRLAAVIGVTRPNQVRERWAHAFAERPVPPADARVQAPARTRSVSRAWLPAHAGPQLHAERAIHMADTSQSARVARVGLARPKDTKDTKDTTEKTRLIFVSLVSFVSFVVTKR